jgi:hypothetical protein
MTLQIRSEREREIAREKLAEVVAKLEEALRLQSQLSARGFYGQVDWTAPRKETHG